MDDSVRGYLLRLLRQNCSDHPANLSKWMRGDDFAQKILELHQAGVVFNNQNILHVMQEIRASRNIEWKQDGKHYNMKPDDMRQSIHNLKKAITDDQSAAV